MGKEQLKSLLQELIDKEISLDQSAKILWQLRYYLELKRDCVPGEGTDHDHERLADRQQLLERQRLQLDHYLVDNNIQSINIKEL